MSTPALKILALCCLLLGVPLARAEATLADLIQAGEREAALELVRAGADVNAIQADGTTALHWAVYRVEEELAILLLRNEARPDVVNAFGSTPLSEAVRLAHAGLVKALLGAGADPNIGNDDGQTPLMLAAWTGVVEVARLLVEHGAEVNAVEQWTGQTALMWAAARNHPEMTQFLIDQGADVEARALVNDWSVQITSEPRNQYRPAGGLTPLLYAARSGCLRCVAAIVEAGADVDLPTPEGVTPLLVAIDNFHFAIAHYLLDAGANAHAFDWWGRTPLYLAVDMRSIESRGLLADALTQAEALRLAERLLDAGVMVDPQLNFHRPGRGGGNGRFADELLTTGATPLLRAAIAHDAEAIRLLLAHGAEVDLPNVMGVTPLIAAAGMATPRGQLSDGSQYLDPNQEEKALVAVQLLLDAGADVNTRVTDTSSYTAEIPRHNNLTDRQGQTALFGTGRWGWIKVAQLLLEHGAEVDVRDEFGKTAVDSALGQGGGEQEEVWEELAAFLRAAGVPG